MNEYKYILYSVEDRIARVTLNAPEKRNALSFQMRDEFTSALKRAEADDAVSLVFPDGSMTLAEHFYQDSCGFQEYNLLVAEAVVAAAEIVLKKRVVFFGIRAEGVLNSTRRCGSGGSSSFSIRSISALLYRWISSTDTTCFSPSIG